MAPDPKQPARGRAVADEDPDHSPMEGMVSQSCPAQPLDIERIDEDRAKSIGPRPGDDPEKDPPAGSLPPFDDPAFSSKPAGSPVQPDAPEYEAPPKDTEYAGHPEFSQDAAANKRPVDVDPSSPQQTSGAGSALAGHTKDA